jgi:hypothetical protein
VESLRLHVPAAKPPSAVIPGPSLASAHAARLRQPSALFAEVSNQL